MGNNNAANQFNSNQWKRVQAIGSRQILKNAQSNLQVEKHYAVSNYGSFQHRYINNEIYKWRKQLNQTLNIVKMYECQIKQQRFGIQQDQYVYTQKIIRLSQGKTFSKPEGFLLIQHLLSGMIMLYQKFGLFSIDIFLIGVSLDGKGKVWINQNYAKNSIQQKNIIQNPTPNQQLVIVNNLVRIVKQRVYNDDFMPEIQFPSNMYCHQAINYINLVRNKNIAFRVNRIYHDRNQFKQDFDLLYKEFWNSQQQRTFNNNLIQHPATIQNANQKPLKNQQRQINSNHNQQRQLKMQKKKTAALLNVIKQTSQTLSSDSNSRARRQFQNSSTQNSQVKDKVIRQPTSSQKKKNPQQNKIHIQQMINQQDIVYPRNQLQRNLVFIKNEEFTTIPSQLSQNNQKPIENKNHPVLIHPINSFSSQESYYIQNNHPDLVHNLNPISQPSNVKDTRNIVQQQKPQTNYVIQSRPSLTANQRHTPPIINNQTGFIPTQMINNSNYLGNQFLKNAGYHNVQYMTPKNMSQGQNIIPYQNMPIRQNQPYFSHTPTSHNQYVHQNMLPQQNGSFNKNIQGNYPPFLNQNMSYNEKVLVNPMNKKNFISQPFMSPHLQPQMVKHQMYSNQIPSNKISQPNNFSQQQKGWSYPQKQYIISRQYQEQYINNGINNVQLCESVMLDRGQIERNMADLQN